MTEPATMVELVEEYLRYRRSLGFDLIIAGQQLMGFAQFADSSGHRGVLTNHLVVQWATLPGRRKRRFPERLLEVVRPFARYRAAVDSSTEVPRRGLLGRARSRPRHHIYTESEITELVEHARRVTPPVGLPPATFAVLFSLLAACGLRVSEALRLTQGDVDLVAGVLTIRETKFRKSRFVPIHATTTQALGTYDTGRGHTSTKPGSDAFFRTAVGASLSYPTVRNVFVRLRKALGWEPLVPRPRIHDLRHSFVCRRLERWYAEGVDVAPRVAALATYLGHAKVTDTYWYLTATPELLSLAATRFEVFAADTKGAPS